MTSTSQPSWVPAAVLAAVVVVTSVVVVFFGSSTPQRTADDDGGGRPAGDGPGRKTVTEERTITEYKAPPREPDEELKDDRLDDRPRPEFDPARVDRRPFGEWFVNSSAAVLQLDLALLQPDREADLLELHPSYAAAVGAVRTRYGTQVLPSVNLIEGKVKQFDDGLYAALDAAYDRGVEGTFLSHVELFKRIHEKLGPQGPASAFLAAALELAGVKVEAKDAAARAEFLRSFEAQEVLSKPVGFYTWDEELQKCFRFLRFLQKEFAPADEAPAKALAVPLSIAAALQKDAALAADYRKAIAFFSRLTNPRIALSAADLIGQDLPDLTAFAALCAQKGVGRKSVAVFPGGSSRETLLFDKLFADGIPPGANLMRELIRAIRSGKVDLTPTADSGWYDHQVYALETLLLPERGAEGDKLLLSRAYKKRMMEAFAAIITTRRETHVRDLYPGTAKSAEKGPPPRRLPTLRPQLRVEPAVSFYLRTARSYEFLRNVLEAAMGRAALAKLHGLRETGPREPNLHDELLAQRDLLYGLYLTAADDIGLKVELQPDECPERDRCYAAALRWLNRAAADPDLAVDVRTAVPVFVDNLRGGAVRCWGTAGVRMARMDAAYAVPPSVKPRTGEGKWLPATETYPSQYLIPVVEFTEFELPAGRVYTRTEWRKVCDEMRGRVAAKP